VGYLNRVIQLDFPDLAGVDDAGRSIIWLTIRNPRLMPGNELVGKSSARRAADGSLIIDTDAAGEAYSGFAKLVIGGNVLDPTVDSDDPPALPMPPGPADVGRYPIEVLNKLASVLADSNPR
jgi:hypothetical protein